MKLKPGDKVRLNNLGLDIAFGTSFGLSHLKKKVMTVVETEYIELDDSDDEIVVVDDPEISTFLLFTSCFDRV